MEDKLFGSFNNTYMTSPSSTCRPKLNDEECMELVYESGQILAKGQRSKASLQNQRMKSILDLYESEYEEDFKQRIHGGCSSIKNLGDTQVVPDSEEQATEKNMMNLSKSDDKQVESMLIDTVEDSEMMIMDQENLKNIEFIPPDEQSEAGQCFDSSSFSFGVSTDLTSDDTEESMYISSSLDDESDDSRPRVPARRRKALFKRKRRAEGYNVRERRQRSDMNKKMRTLQDLLPNCDKEDKASLLDETIEYMRTLQFQVQMMKMRNRFVTPLTMLPLAHYSQMGLGMQMGALQSVPALVPGAGLPGISDSANLLRFCSHPGLIPMQYSSLFSPMESCAPQSVPPSNVPPAASPVQPPNTTSLSNLDKTSYTRNQGTVDRPFEYLKIPEFSQVANLKKP